MARRVPQRMPIVLAGMENSTTASDDMALTRPMNCGPYPRRSRYRLSSTL